MEYMKNFYRSVSREGRLCFEVPETPLLVIENPEEKERRKVIAQKYLQELSEGTPLERSVCKAVQNLENRRNLAKEGLIPPLVMDLLVQGVQQDLTDLANDYVTSFRILCERKKGRLPQYKVQLREQMIKLESLLVVFDLVLPKK